MLLVDVAHILFGGYRTADTATHLSNTTHVRSSDTILRIFDTLRKSNTILRISDTLMYRSENPTHGCGRNLNPDVVTWP
jgi:hypothetical protein